MASSGAILLQTDTGVTDLTPFVSSFVYDASLLRGHVIWSLSFATKKWDYWQQLMVGQGQVLRVKIKGVRDSFQTETKWLDLVVDQSEGRIRAARMDGMLVGGGKEILMKEKDKRRAFANSTAAQVIQRIALDYQMQANVAASSGTRTWWQVNQTDWDMLKEALEYYVPSADNRGDAYLSIEGRELILKPINFATPSTRLYDLTHIQKDDRIKEVFFKYYGGQVDRKGGPVVEARGFDPSTGLPVTFTVTPVTAGRPVLAPKLPKSYASKNTVVYCPSGELQEVRALALRKQAEFAARYFGVSVTVLNDLTVKLRDMFEISAKDEEGNNIAMGGRYGVFAYRIEYTKQEIKTKVTGYRSEAYVGDVPATGANVSRSIGTDQQRQQGGGRAATVVQAIPLGS